MKKCKKLMAQRVVGNNKDRTVDQFLDHYVRGMHYLLEDA